VKLVLEPASTTVSGRIRWSAKPSRDVKRVEFQIDGKTKWTEYVSPYMFGGDGSTFDASTLAPGKHTFAVRAVHADDRVATASAIVQTKQGGRTLLRVDRAKGKASVARKCTGTQKAKQNGPRRGPAKACKPRR